MQFVCLQEHFKSALAIVERAVASTSTLPILNTVLLRACAKRLELSATDLSLSITTHVEAHVIAEGMLALPAGLMLDFVGGLPGERVVAQLHPRTQVLNLACARFNANIKGLDAADFPAVPTAEPSVSVEARVMRAACEQVAFAAAPKDDARAVLTGVQFELADGILRVIATDANRLATTTVPVQGDDPALRSLVVPARACLELARIIPPRSEGPVRIGLSSTRQIVFQYGETQLVSNLVEGKYPPVLPLVEQATKGTTCVRVKRAELARALKVAEVIAEHEQPQAPTVTLNIAPGQPLALTAAAGEGDHHSALEVQVEGQGLQLAVQTRFLATALHALGEHDEVLLTFQSPTHPIALRPAKVGAMLHLVMPALKKEKV